MRWEPPCEDMIVINVDGVFKSNSRARCGRLICDTRGLWLVGFSKSIGRCNSLSAELWGVLGGLQFAWNKGYKKVELQTDNMKITEAFNARASCIRKGSGILQQIKAKLKEHWDVRVKHVHRE